MVLVLERSYIIYSYNATTFPLQNTHPLLGQAIGSLIPSDQTHPTPCYVVFGWKGMKGKREIINFKFYLFVSFFRGNGKKTKSLFNFGSCPILREFEGDKKNF